MLLDSLSLKLNVCYKYNDYINLIKVDVIRFKRSKYMF